MPYLKIRTFDFKFEPNSSLNNLLHLSPLFSVPLVDVVDVHVTWTIMFHITCTYKTMKLHVVVAFFFIMLACLFVFKQFVLAITHLQHLD